MTEEKLKGDAAIKQSARNDADICDAHVKMKKAFGRAEKVEAALAAARAEIERLTTPDMVWHDDDNVTFSSLTEFMQGLASGQVLQAYCARRLPTVFSVRLLDGSIATAATENEAAALAPKETNNG